MNDLQEVFWSSSVSELAQGYRLVGDRYTCLICGAQFIKGVIYPEGEVLNEAERAVKSHILHRHGSVFEYLIGLEKNNGLTDLQRHLLSCFHRGLNDRDVASELGIGSTSTVRNHRFRLKEKEKQAKVFLALMEIYNKSVDSSEQFVEFHRNAKMVDERFAITNEERQKAIAKYFEDNGEGPLTTWPKKEKLKIIVLQHIARNFQPGRNYTEKEVNGILKTIYSDYVTLRRYLIEYGFLDRTQDCSKYWALM